MNHKHLLTITLLLISPYIFPQGAEEMTVSDEKMTDIPYIKLSAELFEKCLPWRDGKYITIEHKGRFATVEWEKIFGKDILTTKPICNFPKQDCTPGYFSASPETGWIWTWDRMKLLCYNADTKLRSDFIPVMSWKGAVDYITPISSDELLLSFFWLDLGKPDCIVNFYYNQRTQFLDTSHEKERSSVHLWKQIKPFGNEFLAFEYDGEMFNSKFFFYNRNKNVKSENQLTKLMTEFFSKTDLSDIYISINKRIIISKSSSSYPLVITWDETYKDISFSMAKHIFPRAKYLGYYEVSSDYHWMFLSVSGYKGLNGDILSKVAFLEISDKYPDMFSPIIFLADDYTEYQQWNHCSFIEHPEYGTCFLAAYDNGKTEEIRLYKMSDVQKEIDKILSEHGE